MSPRCQCERPNTNFTVAEAQGELGARPGNELYRRELSANHILPGRAECTDSELVPGFDCVHLKLCTLGSNMSRSGKPTSHLAPWMATTSSLAKCFVIL